MMKFKGSSSFDSIDNDQFLGHGSTISLQNPLTSITASPQFNHIAVGGKEIKILSLNQMQSDSNEFLYQLRVQSTLQTRGPQKNLTMMDVKWNPNRDFADTIASSATNGTLIIWDLNKSVNRQKRTYSEHNRTVNRICWQPNEPNILWTGGQDNTFRCWDIRESNSRNTIEIMSGVRDISVSPITTNLIAIATSGQIQLWDIKNLKSPLVSISAHDDEILSLSWHPKFKNIIASGGMDKMVKFWDINCPQKSLYSLQTTSPVSKVLWRPNFPHQIATASSKSDFSVNVWDIHNPYIPSLSYRIHTEIVTGMLWLHDAPNHLITCSKDCSVAVQVFQDAEQPKTTMRTVDFDISHINNIAFVGAKIDRSPQELSSKLSPLIPSKDLESTQKFNPQPTNNNWNGLIHLFQYENKEEQFSEFDKFLYYAKNYIYYDSNYTTQEKCLINATTSSKIKDYQKEKVWMLLKLFHSEYKENLDRFQHFHKDNKIQNKYNGKQDDLYYSSESEDGEPSFLSRFVNDEDHITTEQNDEDQISTELQNNATFFDKNSDSEDTSSEENDFDSNQNFFLDSPIQWNSRRRKKREKSPKFKSHTPILQLFESQSIENNQESCCLEHSQVYNVFSETLNNLLEYYSDEGDVQMCVAIAAVMEGESPLKVSNKTLLHWQLSYIELLRKRKLFVYASDIVKFSKQESIQNMSLNSTTIHSSCSDCGRPIESVNQTVCEKCNKKFMCSVCHLTYPGIWFFCQQCGCGGHLDCMLNLLCKQQECPNCLAPIENIQSMM